MREDKMNDSRPIHDALKVLDNFREEASTCRGSSLDCISPGRREFLKLAGVGLVGTVTGPRARVMAGNFFTSRSEGRPSGAGGQEAR